MKNELKVEQNSGIHWQFFPKNSRMPDFLKGVIEAFEKHLAEIDSTKGIPITASMNLPASESKSNIVLECVREDLETIGYQVESGKKADETINVPVFFGLNGIPEKTFKADAYNQSNKVVVEVEAGRGYANFQFLKDFFEACVMEDVEYCVIALMNQYHTKKSVTYDFSEAKLFMDVLFSSGKIQTQLKGLLLIGY